MSIGLKRHAAPKRVFLHRCVSSGYVSSPEGERRLLVFALRSRPLFRLPVPNLYQPFATNGPRSSSIVNLEDPLRLFNSSDALCCLRAFRVASHIGSQLFRACVETLALFQLVVVIDDHLASSKKSSMHLLLKQSCLTALPDMRKYKVEFLSSNFVV